LENLDHTLTYLAPDKISCQLTSLPPDTAWHSVKKKNGQTKYFTEAEILSLLSHEQKKDLLVVDFRIQKKVQSCHELIEQSAVYLPFFLSLGYKRLIVQSPFQQGRVICYDGQGREASDQSAAAADRYSSDCIFVAECLSPDPDKSGQAKFRFLKGLKGPNTAAFYLQIRFAKENLITDNFKPQVGSKWILFIKNFMPDKSGVLSVYQSKDGAIKWSESAENEICDALRRKEML
jgi:hypothetical protein